MSENQQTDVSWALKLLEREPDYKENLFSKYYHELCCALVGVTVPIAGNHIYRRPIWAGIQSHILCLIVGVGVGHFLKLRERDILGRRDAQLRDYIMLHPEDFPPPDRKKYGEVLLPWSPIR